MAYSKAQEMAAQMLGVDWPGVLHYDLIRVIYKIESWCNIAGQELGADALAAAILAWELTYPDRRAVCE